MKSPTGEIVKSGSNWYYKISDVNYMEPFFINVVSDSDIVFFVSSKGGLTAGRRNIEGSFFPYETDDKIHQQSHTGPKTIIKVGDITWTPFNRGSYPQKGYRQNIYKNLNGNSLLFEEENEYLELIFRYEWASSEKYGMIRRVELENIGQKEYSISILDGVENILPAGTNPRLQETSSCLIDGYKTVELLNDSSLAVYSLTTTINDAPQAIEILQANVAWSTEDPSETILLSSRQLTDFFCRGKIKKENVFFGGKGAYFLHKEFKLNANTKKEWAMVFDVNYTQKTITELYHKIQTKDFSFLNDSIVESSKSLRKIVANCDGLQLTADKVAQHYHYLNALYNGMRGGVFMNGYHFSLPDFRKFATLKYKVMATDKCLATVLDGCSTIQEAKDKSKDYPQLYRLVLEYLPLTFSRRHGDPSRPWNKYDIHVKDEQGEWITHYEGNWRDIFQNWEALATTYPLYLENFISKFLNASTVDGYNPYRINSEGLDWEKLDEDDPFTGFGYWGDHQIVYLTKLLKQIEDYQPQWINENLGKEHFSYANLPYEICSYEEILVNSKNTIIYNFKKEKEINAKIEKIGQDGKLLLTEDTILLVSLMEKLMIPILTKLCNLLPNGGIWMNTQRPEWNDANNAIVGVGLSMVTTIQLYEYLVFLKKILVDTFQEVSVSKYVVLWLQNVVGVFKEYNNGKTDNPKKMLDRLGYMASDYRKAVYTGDLGQKQKISTNMFKELIDEALPCIEKTIIANKKDLFISYNNLNPDFTVTPMKAMLEGQSAIIASGFLSGESTLDLLKKMYKSSLYNAQQKQFTLYPVSEVKPFMERNQIVDFQGKSDEKIVVADGNIKRFHYTMRTKDLLKNALEASTYTVKEQKNLLECYNKTFGHNSFIGRSQAMYKYEGIGCIYWHQNGKLVLALQDTMVQEYRARGITPVLEQLKAMYYKLTDGMGNRKTPNEAGGFPLEPYSHTSYYGKVQQPGMTGQVKESILARRRELGVIVDGGRITFHPYFINQDEFLSTEDKFVVYNRNGEEYSILVPQNALAFTLYRTPVIYYKVTGTEKVSITYGDGTKKQWNKLSIPLAASKEIIEGSNVLKIEVEMNILT